MQTKISSFPPICGDNPQILILGTMPGEESLKEGKYYCSSRNSFWKMIAAIFNNGKDFANYKEKTDCLTHNHIALWDVYASCSRSGSLDKNIADAVPNDIAQFLEEHSAIQRIVTNGKKAQSTLLKFLKKHSSIRCIVINGRNAHSVLLEPQKACINIIIATSTSNANTHQHFEQKVAEWRAVLVEE